MFKHLLVPLDGSALAESALSPAAQLAARMSASVTLIHLIEKGAPTKIHKDRHLVSAAEATDYLNEVANRALFKGLRVETHVHTTEVSDVALSIAEHSAELAPDLIVMTTHGRGGTRRFLFGAIAQQVISLGKTPVLMVRPSGKDQLGSENGSTDWGVILAPIDGDSSHEKGLPTAADLARIYHAQLHLLMVVPKFGNLHGLDATVGRVLPSATRIRLEIDLAGASDYLTARTEELLKDGVETSSEILRSDPAHAIVQSARRLRANLIVLGTHGRAGADAFWHESVAARVIARTRIPLLLMPLKD